MLLLSNCLFLRWMHAVCDNLFSEEEVEQAADEGFDCTSCQPYVVKPVGEYCNGSEPFDSSFPFSKGGGGQHLLDRGLEMRSL